MQPKGVSTKQDQDYVGQRTGTETPGDREMKAPADAPGFPLSLEVIERQGRKTFVGAAATATLTDKQMPILHPDRLTDAVRAGDLLDRAAFEGWLAHGWPLLGIASAKHDGLTVRRMTVCICPSFFALGQRSLIGESLCHD